MLESLSPSDYSPCQIYKIMSILMFELVTFPCGSKFRNMKNSDDKYFFQPFLSCWVAVL